MFRPLQISYGLQLKAYKGVDTICNFSTHKLSFIKFVLTVMKDVMCNTHGKSATLTWK